MANRKAGETVAREALEDFFDRLGERQSWCVGADPPDWIVEVAGGRFAVEVTQVMAPATVGGGKERSERGVEVATRRWVRELEAAALAAGELRGTYILTCGPVPDFGTVSHDLENGIRAYCRASHGLDPELATPAALPADWQITKFDSRGAELCVVMRFARVQGDDPAEFVALFSHSVSRKAAHDYGEEAILLLVDSYHFVAGAAWQRVAATHPHVGAFHTVARIFEGRRVQVLSSTNDRWRAVGCSEHGSV